MTKIAIDARQSGTSTGRYVDKLLEYLHKLKLDFEVVVLTKKHRVEFCKQIAPSFTVVETSYKEFTLSEQLGFKREVEKLKADLVHFAIVQQPVLYYGKVVTTMHDLTTIRFNNPSKNQLVFAIKQRVYKWLNEKVAVKSTAIITASNFVKQDIVHFTNINPNKIVVTYEAADPIVEPAEPLPELTGKQFIMHVGRPLPHKNLQRLIDAFAKLQIDHPELRLVLAGKKDVLFEAHERYVHEHDIPNVLFTDFVAEGELRWLYEHCAAYVFPSLSEGFGLPGLEAMLHSAPVVSSNATCLPEIYGEAAHYFPPLDIKAMTTAINDVLTNKDLRAKLIAAGKVQAQKYSWRRMAKQTLEVYKKALNEK